MVSPSLRKIMLVNIYASCGTQFNIEPLQWNMMVIFLNETLNQSFDVNNIVSIRDPFKGLQILEISGNISCNGFTNECYDFCRCFAGPY